MHNYKDFLTACLLRENNFFVMMQHRKFKIPFEKSFFGGFLVIKSFGFNNESILKCMQKGNNFA